MDSTNATLYSVDSENSTSKYEVRFYEDGRETCECPSYLYSRTKTCKHIEGVRRNGGGFKGDNNTDVKVFQFTYGDQTTVLADDAGNVEAGVKEALKVLPRSKELVIKRLV